LSGPVRIGLDAVLAGDVPHLRDVRLGLVLHPASVTAGLDLSVDALLAGDFTITALFGPQHGARGEKQDNMIESSHYTDPVTRLPVHSLYSEVRKPTPGMLEGLDALVFDLQDVGVRVYTFVWTMALAMQACAEAGIRFVVLDRPNPIGGTVMEGPVLREGFQSFVGLYPVPLRHGLTCGELARWLNVVHGIGCDLEVVPCEGWQRSMTWADTGLPWVRPRPNLPTPTSCDVYPGMVLLEGTTLSEGRGTTLPFELFGAPWIDPVRLADEVSGQLGAGLRLRPCHFEPTYQKHAGKVCGGGQLHVADAKRLRSVRAAVTLLKACHDLWPERWEWRSPPYEYEEVLPPIDILWGHDGLRRGIEDGVSVDHIMSGVDDDIAGFRESVAESLIYD